MCRTCVALTPAERKARVEEKEKREGEKREEAPGGLVCGECRGAMGSGVRFWVCGLCGGECKGRVHACWGR